MLRDSQTQHCDHILLRGKGSSAKVKGKSKTKGLKMPTENASVKGVSMQRTGCRHKSQRTIKEISTATGAHIKQKATGGGAAAPGNIYALGFSSFNSESPLSIPQPEETHMFSMHIHLPTFNGAISCQCVHPATHSHHAVHTRLMSHPPVLLGDF